MCKFERNMQQMMGLNNFRFIWKHTCLGMINNMMVSMVATPMMLNPDPAGLRVKSKSPARLKDQIRIIKKRPTPTPRTLAPSSSSILNSTKTIYYFMCYSCFDGIQQQCYGSDYRSFIESRYIEKDSNFIFTEIIISKFYSSKR